ncbi:uncharacterized protein PGTG_04905 [Puccinia graminis f. sp. tritici CRL 75-36-700-3]|uniref:Uncharacterized protein n=1 Tax=Puccinia graminis f. sp. tritici (strain CRL 75-36-700-3 / race SCCL) TaxID=418459 RepID=E3K392_PUCGT|nr:uncharacterized protein PGTG_04905 [Puccinia graminis f. sp. tritici CRL 75-36-700-3]EFP78949.1 hypothetical protein PGTG_04905 [Puccinia graminis f. sp. tritici CRL 75-36-700-3]
MHCKPPSDLTDPKDAKLAKVQAQLAELVTVVNEERKARKELEAQLAKKEAELVATVATTNIPPQAPTAPVKGLKIGAPNKFDGTHGAKAEVFIKQVNLYILANQHLLSTDRAIMVFILSYLTGPASLWAQPWMRKVMCKTETIKHDNFVTQFNAMYCDTEKKNWWR